MPDERSGHDHCSRHRLPDGFTVGIVSYDTTTLAAKLETDAAKAAMEGEGWSVVTQDPKGDAAQAKSLTLLTNRSKTLPAKAKKVYAYGIAAVMPDM